MLNIPKMGLTTISLITINHNHSPVAGRSQNKQPKQLLLTQGPSLPPEQPKDFIPNSHSRKKYPFPYPIYNLFLFPADRKKINKSLPCQQQHDQRQTKDDSGCQRLALISLQGPGNLTDLPGTRFFPVSQVLQWLVI